MAEIILSSEKLFERLVMAIKGKPEYQQRVVAHIRETHGHATLPSFHRNGATEQEKIQTYGKCLGVINRVDRGERTAWGELKGQVAQGQAVSLAPEPKPEAVTSRDTLAEARAEAETPLLEPQKPKATPVVDAMLQMAEAKQRLTTVESALDGCGIGRDARDNLRPVFEAGAKFCADLNSRIASQAVYNALVNVPTGIQDRSTAYSPKKVLRMAIASACSNLVGFDIVEAMLLAADILEDVNAHPEAKMLRDFARKEIRKSFQDED